MGAIYMPTIFEKLALFIAAEAEFSMERFDRTVCEGRKDGIAIPVTHRERELCSAHARHVLAGVTFQAHKYQIPGEVLKWARKEAQKHIHEIILGGDYWEQIERDYREAVEEVIREIEG
jgi:hypothetical protein